VITEARAALEKGDVTGLLKWVSKEGEKEIRTVFAASLAVRAKGKEARELAEAVFVRDISACSSCGRRGSVYGAEGCGEYWAGWYLAGELRLMGAQGVAGVEIASSLRSSQ
jgi:hypothetical protein